MPDQHGSLHRVSGFVSGVNWRATRFAAPVPPNLTCALCHVISRATFVLPCLHTLCESCANHSLSDGNMSCPFDEESFAGCDCPEVRLPAATAERLKACCWNEAHGCTFVGTLQAVLTHYEQECTFHAVTCSRCNDPVLHQDLPRHYREGCRGEVNVSAAGDTLRQGVLVSAQDIGRCLDELKALIRYPYQDRLPALQSKMNEVLEQARNINAEIQAMARSCRKSEHDITQAVGQLSTTFVQEIQSQQPMLLANLKKHFRMNEISEQVRNHGMQIDAIAKTLSDSERRLSDQLTEAKQELSTTFAQKLECQQRELSAKLETISELERSNSGETETTGANEMPWRLEKRHILRKLELMATDSHAYLEYLRTSADRLLKQQVLEYTPVVASYHADTVVMPLLTGKCESDEAGYIVSIKNIDGVFKPQTFISLFTGWYRRDRYLHVAACTHGFSLIVCLKWGPTEQGFCSASPVANVYIKHPDRREQNFRMAKYDYAGKLGEHHGFPESFSAHWKSHEKKTFLRDGKLTLIVSFKI